MATAGPASQVVAALIKATREARGMSQVALAEAAHLEKYAIATTENGRRKVDVDMLFNVAEALGVPVTALLDGTAPTLVAAEKYGDLQAAAEALGRPS